MSSPPADGHPGCLQFGAVMIKADMNMKYTTACGHMLSFYSGKHPGMK